MCKSTQEHWVLLIPTEVQKEGGRPALVMNRLVILKKIQQKIYDFQVHLFFSIIISLRLPFFSAIFPYVVFFSTKKNIFFIVYLEEAYFSFSKSSYSNRDGGKTVSPVCPTRCPASAEIPSMCYPLPQTTHTDPKAGIFPNFTGSHIFLPSF